MKYTLSIQVENQPGVLSRVVSLFSRRGYNIDSLAVAAGEDPKMSRITIVGEGDGYTLEQVEKQLNKLIPVVKVREIGSRGGYISGELIYIKIGCDKNTIAQVNQVITLMQAEAAHVSPTSITVKYAGDHEKCEMLCTMLRPFGIKAIARSGTVALETL